MESSRTEEQSSPSPNVFKVLTVDTPKRNSSTNLPDPNLQNGRILPKKFQDQFTELNAWGKPLEDIDPYYENGKTFIVVSSNYRIFRYSSHHSLFLFDPLNTLRRFFIFILTNWIFCSVMTTAVLLDFTFQVNLLSEARSIQLDHGRVPRVVFLFIYLAELFLKCISMGFVMSPFTYLRSFWSWLDLMVIIESLWETLDFDTVWIFSTVVLLKIVPYHSGLHLAFDFCISCALKLKEMIIASIAVMTIFTIMGVQMYMGILTQKCIRNFNASDYLNYTEEELHKQWHDHTSNDTNWYREGERLCGNVSGTGFCPEGYVCLKGYGSNPDFGYTSFDSFFWGFLSVLRMVTQDFTESLMKQIFVTAGHFHEIYFFFIIVFGTFGLGTFAYSVVAHTFLEMKATRDENENSASQNCQSRSDRYAFSRMFQSWNLPPGFNSFRRKIHCFAFHPFSEVCITCIIILDVLLMTFNIEQSIFMQIFCWIYILEFVVKLFAEGPRDYFQRREHILDTIIVVLFLFTLFVHSPLLTSFLVMRMFKLFPRWPSLNFIIQSFVNTLKYYYFIFLLLIIVMLVNAARGTVFNSDLFDDLYEPRWNFKDFEHSFMMVFRIACGEWIESMWDTMLLEGFVGVTFFIPVVLVTYLILTIAAAAIIVETGETFSKIEFQENALSSKFEDGLQRVCVPLTWLRSKINPGGQTHDILEEAPIHRDSSPGPNSVGDTERHLNIIDKIIYNKCYSILSIVVLLWCSFMLTFEIEPHDEDKPKLNISHVNAEGNETHHSDSSYVFQLSILFYSDILFTVYFGLDIILNLLSCIMKKRWVSSGWIFDLILVTEMIFNFIMYAPHSSPLHGFFYVKCFRLFMLVSRLDGLKAVISGLITEITLLWKYVLAGCFILLAFDIQGVQLFHHRYARCVDPVDFSMPDVKLIDNKSMCLLHNFTWETPDANFDNTLNGVVALFYTLTLNGWLQVLHSGVDIREIDDQPVRDASFHNIFYFIYVISMGCFFLFFVYVGIIIHYFRTDKYKGIFMSFNQFFEYKMKTRQLLESTSEETATVKIPEPTWKGLKFFYNIVESPFFDKFIMSVIIYQILTSAFEFYSFHASSLQISLWVIMDLTHFFVMIIFTVEMICKLLGWRQHYFKNIYNRIDFVVTIAFIEDVFVGFISNIFISPTLLSILRIFRIFQFEPFRRRAVLSRKYLKSLGLVRPALLNLFLFLAINLFSFSLMFMAIFHNAKLTGILDIDFNFRSFGKSFSLLYQMATFGGWDGIYKSLTNENNCYQSNSENEGNCGFLIKPSLLIFCYLSVSVITVLNIYIVFTLEFVKRLSENESERQTNNDTTNNTEMSSNNANSSSANVENSHVDRMNFKEFTNSSFT